MSKFVNYNKRSVSLPPGCKDLADVLRKTQIKTLADVFGGAQTTKIIRDDHVTEPISGIAKYILIVFESSNTVWLHISSQGEQLSFILFKFDGQIQASVLVQHDSAQEFGVRKFFNGHNLASFCDSTMPESFNPNIPWVDSYRILQPPTNVPVLIELVMDMFRDVCGLNDASQFRITCREFQ